MGNTDSGTRIIPALVNDGKGMAEYVTSSGVRVLLCHYSADPEKSAETFDGRLWLENAAHKGYPGGMKGSKWQQEMELNFGYRQSMRVWPDWLERVEPKIVCRPFNIMEVPHWPVYVGYDYGSTNPFAFIAIAWESEDSYYVIDEIYAEKTLLHHQIELLKRRPWFERVQGFIGDPSIWHRTQNAVKSGQPYVTSVGEIISDQYDVTILKGDNSPGSDVACIHYLQSVAWKNLEAPKMKIFGSCKSLLRELKNLRYKEWREEKSRADHNKYETIVNKQNHAWDALKYLLLWRQGDAPEAIEAPVGSFDWYRNRLISMKKAREMILE